MTSSGTYFTTNHFVCTFRSSKWACPLRVTKRVSEMSNCGIVWIYHVVDVTTYSQWPCNQDSGIFLSPEMSNREIVASLRDNRYSRRSVYVFGYTMSWMSWLSLSGLTIMIPGYFCPPRWVIVNRIATLRDDRYIRTIVYVFGCTILWITRSARFVFPFRTLYAPTLLLRLVNLRPNENMVDN